MVKKLSCVSCGSLKRFPHTFTGISRNTILWSLYTVGLMRKDCSSNFRNKHSNVLVLCLLRKLLEQSLVGLWHELQSPNEAFFY